MRDHALAAAGRYLAVALVAGAVLAACATNPVTGERQLMLISEADEIAIGRQADPEIVASMGLYGDEELQSYVQRLGAGLAADSERPHLPWTFRVLDDPLVNAFALPGGYIYVTRGILSHMNSEAELVGVLGHEIGHVTARHGASRLSKAQLAQAGLVVGSVASPEFAEFADLAQMGLGLLFLKYSRDDERQADDLGLRYSIQGGYDARQMPIVFATLKRVGEASGDGSGLPSWLATHPDPGAREERIGRQLAESGIDFSGRTVARESYLGRLDAMVFGENPREGFFREREFLHPDLAFRLDFPAGWKTRNTRQSVDAVSPNQDAAVALSLAAEADPDEAARAFLGQQGIEAGPLQSGRIHGHPVAGAGFEVPGQRPLRGRVAFVRYGENTYRLLGYTLSERWSGYAPAIGGFIGSFRELTDRAALAVQPARIEIVHLSAETSLDAFHRRYPSSVPIETVALINHAEVGGRLGPGHAKRVVGGERP